MNDNVQQTLTHLNEVLQKSTSGAIVLPSNPSIDAVAAATALYLGLHKMGKNVTLASSSKTTYSLSTVDKIQDQLSTSGDDLVISFPYNEGSIDKVDYNIQGNNFNLIVTPRQGFPKLDPKQVKYNYTGGKLNFIITIDRHLTNSFYGSVNFVNKTSSSISEMVLKLLQSLGVEIDRDMATNLYAGISASTNNFTSYSVTADTFETIATLLRFGAIKKTIGKPVPQRGFQPQQPMNPAFNQPRQSSFPQPRFNNQPDMVTPIDQVEQEPKGADAATPQDWLKPKIFKGGGGLV